VGKSLQEKLQSKSLTMHTVAEKCDYRRIWRLSPLSRRFLRQLHFSATVWTRLNGTSGDVDGVTSHRCGSCDCSDLRLLAARQFSESVTLCSCPSVAVC